MSSRSPPVLMGNDPHASVARAMDGDATKSRETSCRRFIIGTPPVSGHFLCVPGDYGRGGRTRKPATNAPVHLQRRVSQVVRLDSHALEVVPGEVDLIASRTSHPHALVVA